jgi:GrpB-like predicted nucleotidyltransferase (UPF0157 family)
MPRKIFVLPYDPLWVESFNVEAKNLRSLFGAEIVEIHHIGSTSIPGMAAKPIVDVLPVVRDIHVIDRFNPVMHESGYLPSGEYGMPGRRYFVKGCINQRSHHIHIYQSGHGDIERHLAFRDYLRTHPNKAKEYEVLKINLVKKYSEDREAYINGKDGFIKELERLALLWKQGMER